MGGKIVNMACDCKCGYGDLEMEKESLEKELKEINKKYTMRGKRISDLEKQVYDLETLLIVECFSALKSFVSSVPVEPKNALTLNEMEIITRAYVDSLRMTFQDDSKYAEEYRAVEKQIYNSNDTNRVTYEYAKDVFEKKIKGYIKVLEEREKGGSGEKTKSEGDGKFIDHILNSIM